MRFRWTKEHYMQEAIKYSTRGEFQSGSKNAYYAGIRHEWHEEGCRHMRRPGNKVKRCLYKLVDEERKVVYFGITHDFYERDHSRDRRKEVRRLRAEGEYVKLTEYIDASVASALEEEMIRCAREEGIYEVLNRHRGGGLGSCSMWSKERVLEEAKNYSSKSDMKRGSCGAFRAARKNGWLPEVERITGIKRVANGYWTKEKCREEALKFRTRNEFRKNSNAYHTAHKKGWIEDICGHMPKRACSQMIRGE